MNIWKKAVSTLATASLLASLVIGVTASSALAATDSSTYLDNCNPASCSMVADGISRLTVEAQVGAAIPAGANLQYDIAGATFSTQAGQSTGAFAAGSVTSTTIKTLVNVIPADADYFTVISPAAAGTATITVRVVPAVGVATTEGTFTIDFYSADQLAVSLANSTNVLSVASASATGGDALATLTTTVKNSVGTGGTGVVGAKVTWTISPYGTLTGGHVQTFTSPATVAGGVATVTINSSGIPGTSTITTSVSYNSVTTTFAPKTFSFYGAVAKLTASARVVSIATGGNADALKVVAEDAGGNKIDGVATVGVLPSGSVVTTLTQVTNTGAGTPVASYGAGTGAQKVNAVCGATAGKVSVQVKYVSGSTTITSNAVDLYCADNVAKTFTIKSAAAAIPAGGNTTITVNILEKNGLPVPDGYEAVVLVNSGAVFGDVTGNTATTYGGDATWTFLAPSQNGIATATGFVANDPVLNNGTLFPTQSVNITIGAAAPSGACTVASALGANATSGFSTASKTAALGKYITFKVSCGAGAAGQTVGILVSTKSGGAYGPYVRLTGRVVGASGDAIFNWRSSSAASVGVRADLGGSLTNWVFGHWR